MNNGDLPAAPTIYANVSFSGQIEILCDQVGLTKREMFAMAAMQGILSNGVDIYESDVVLFNDCFIAQVKYMGCAFAVITKSIYENRDFDFHLIDAFESVEVIGNIYQNQELLEQSK